MIILSDCESPIPGEKDNDKLLTFELIAKNDKKLARSIFRK